MGVLDLVVGLVLLVALVGVVVPVLPGSLLAAVALLVWAGLTGGTTAWVAAGTGVAVLLVGAVASYALPGRRLHAAGVPGRTLATGAAAAVVGFFVVPVLGLFLGFVAGVWAAEVARVGSTAARTSTRQALLAVGLSVLVEATAVLVAIACWAVGVALVP